MMHFQFTSLDEIDFDALFAGSLPKMDEGTLVWPNAGMSVDEKKAHLLGRLNLIAQQPNALCFRCVVDGDEVAAIFGLVRNGKYFAGYSLVRPDSSGSRSFIYRQDVLDSQAAFLRSKGFDAIHGPIPHGSPAEAGISARHNVSKRKGRGAWDDAEIKLA